MMTKLLHDDILGEISLTPEFDLDGTQNGCWQKREYLNLLGQTVTVEFEPDGEAEPTEEQRRIYIALKDIQLSLKAGLQEALFNYYQAAVIQGYFRHIYGNSERGYASMGAPALSESHQVMALLKPVRILILRKPSYIGNEGVEDFLIYWECTWDGEHPLWASYRDWVVYGVGQG